MRSIQWLCAALLLAASAAMAQGYPDTARPVRMILPFGAGTSTDVLGRAIARGMADVAGLNVVVDNRPGGEAVIGAQAVKQAAPDGYTFLLTTLSTQVLNPLMMARLPYDPVADFIPLVGVGKTAQMVNLGPSTPFASAREFIASARTQPGKYTAGTGSPFTRLTAEAFQLAAGIELLIVPHKNLTDALTSLSAGQLDLVIVDPGTAGAFYKNRVRAVATTGAARMDSFREVPTLREEGLDGFELVGWFATYFPAGTPPAVVQSMRDILQQALKTRYVTEVQASYSMEPLNLAGAQLAAFQREELARWRKAVQAAGLQAR